MLTQLQTLLRDFQDDLIPRDLLADALIDNDQQEVADQIRNDPSLTIRDILHCLVYSVVAH